MSERTRSSAPDELPYGSEDALLPSHQKGGIERGETKDMTVKRLEEIAKILEVTRATILNFDEKQVLNNTSNHQEGGYSGNIMYIKESFDRERQQYEARLKHQDEEIVFVREMCKKGK